MQSLGYCVRTPRLICGSSYWHFMVLLVYSPEWLMLVCTVRMNLYLPASDLLNFALNFSKWCTCNSAWYLWLMITDNMREAWFRKITNPWRPHSAYLTVTRHLAEDSFDPQRGQGIDWDPHGIILPSDKKLDSSVKVMWFIMAFGPHHCEANNIAKCLLFSNGL